MSIANYIYSQESSKISIIVDLRDNELKDKYGKITNFNIHDDEFLSHLHNETLENNSKIRLYLLCLDLCHTALPEEKNGGLIYQA